MNYKRLILIVLILSVLSFVGYFVYKKYMAKNTEDEEEEGNNISAPITDYRDPTEEATISEDLVVDSSAGNQGISLA